MRSSLDQKADPALGHISKAGAVGTGGEVSLSSSSDQEQQSLKQDGTFVTDGLDEHYRPLETYEGYHRYDPHFRWEESEEKRIVRKIDWRITSWACLMFFALQLDRGNIVQAVSDNMLPDLGLTTNDYNYGQTVFYASFLAAELPSQMVSKWVGPDNWIPIQMVSWSLVASFQAFLSGKTSFLVCRALLGLIEGGFIPDVVLYLSYFFKSKELPKRLSLFWAAYQSTQIVSAFLAYGILRLRGYHGMAGWQWLFALEGLLTGTIGIISAFYLPPSPTQTASWFRGKKGWFSEHEEKIMVNRILRDDPSKGDMHNRQALSLTMFWECLCDYHMWPIYLIGLTWLIPTSPLAQYLTLQLKSAGFHTFNVNLLTIPAYVLFIVLLLFFTWLSERINQRLLLGLATQIWAFPCLIALEVLPGSVSSWAKWALSTLIVGAPYIHPVLVAITSRNAGTVRTRTVASAIYNMCVQASNIIASNIYREGDKPLYRTGNKVLIFFCVLNCFLYVGAKIFYVRVNAKRDKIWNEMSHEQKNTYLATTKDKGNKRLDFRFAH
ncbi:MFS general substrate transporter [Aulographum hederae CBS 113979]|uniref:MFS general substrate transporter n=1 Tax=Aulographum hederae CBS 113979 TaxID=1176131 RepID=A0A6G1GK41_9PEZI|nr:MFS general substrate transporter [Aulographum hederae CBS 113979]